MPFPYPSRHEGHPSAVAFHLPVEGSWRVVWGGERGEQNRPGHLLASRRWGLIMVRKGPEGGTATGVSAIGVGAAGTDAGADPTWGSDVLAPCAGRVVALVDGLPELGAGEFTGAEAGNLLVLEAAPGQYVFLYPLLAGSFSVAVGDEVARGARLARVGRSANSPLVGAVHLACHLQDSPQLDRGDPVPWFFHDYSADGLAVERGLPIGGLARGGGGGGQSVRASVP